MSDMPLIEARLSWVAYCKFIVLAFLVYVFPAASVIGMIAAGISILSDAVFDPAKMSGILFVVLSLIFCGFFLYGLSRIRRCRVYIDADGIWFESGLFPWSHGIRGVRWENFDQALFRKSFFSWISGSYTVFLYDRYGRTVEVKDVWQGRRWVGAVNDYALND